MCAPTVATGHLAAGATSSAGADIADLADFDDGDGVLPPFETSSDDGDSNDGDNSALTDHMTEAVHERVDAAGVPRPLAKGLLTLSGKPATSWEALVHLDAIKVHPTLAYALAAFGDFETHFPSYKPSPCSCSALALLRSVGG